ncbi:MAG: GIY-YIG nuclease family protein [Candidatus Kerfeldbacteria bacterium]|nr:GIY-YIG nuclease family protein [Candidatus Kerfeldbacteria bacterium]
MYYVYILKSVRANRHYIGSTDNVVSRIARHNRGRVRSTKSYQPWQLVKTERFKTKTEARKRENQLKRSGHPERHTMALSSSPV